MSEAWILIQNIAGGLSIGAIYALVALGYSMVYRSMGLVNFAHGSIYMIGTYLGMIFYMGLVGVRLPYWVSFVVGILATATLGLVIERILRPLADLDLMLMLAGTIGLGIVLDNLAIVIWGAEGFAVPLQTAITPIRIAGLTLVPHLIHAFLVACALMVGLEVFLKRTKIGKGMRASAAARFVAGTMGVNVNVMNAITFAIGAGLASAAGILAAPIVYVNPAMSAAVGIKGFAAAILGGFGNIRGAVLGGLLFGVIENVATAYMSSAYKDGLAFVIMALVLMFLPSGILGEETVQKV